MYKKGVRWTEYIEWERIVKPAIHHMVLDHIHTISMMVMLIIINSSHLRCLVTQTSTLTPRWKTI